MGRQCHLLIYVHLLHVINRPENMTTTAGPGTDAVYERTVTIMDYENACKKCRYS